MIAYREFLLQTRIEPQRLEIWISEGWIRCNEEGDGRSFSEADVARARLIQDLRQHFGVNDEGIDVILDLVDQIHGLRRALGHALSSAASPQDR